MTSTFPRMHVSLYVSDIAATVRFYTTFFGQEPTKVKPGYAKWTLAEPSLIISFVENPDRVQAHFGHLGFQVETPEQLTERRDVAAAAGLITKEEIGTACCYAKQDKFWATDPDGVQWEVYYFHEDAEFNDPHYSVGAEGTEQCCIAPARTAVASAEIPVMAPMAFTLVDTAQPSTAAKRAAVCEPGAGCC